MPSALADLLKPERSEVLHGYLWPTPESAKQAV